MNKNYSLYLLRAKTDAMSKFLNLDKLIQGEKNSPAQIRSYYKINHWAFRFFHSQDGFMHFRLSPNGVFTDEDVYYQPDTVSRYIKPGAAVLELGAGQGANLLYLSHSHPDARFAGLDLFPPKELKSKLPENATVFEQNYSNLSQFQDNSIDVVYAFETIVHNTDKEKVLREVHRVLKPGGVVIIYDYALKDRFETYDAQIQKAIALTSKGGASPMIESLAEWHGHFTNCGLTIEESNDLTREVLPDLKRLERKGAKVLERPWLAKIMFRLLPEQFFTNIILGYLGYDLGNADICTLYEWILRKPKQ